ncbi:opioid receptor, delta 1b isoform X2 [Clarias gariepinus]|uniref:opioid receptor, delta 1b isoform X2 n=1 Tax=Clarias gariepinus TaxID=13013 RepID=UPI00234D4CFE|nr:opioid receptor, delta 1b isoform X2 [Clarias gariepinus]
MDPPAVTGSGFGDRYIITDYNDNFTEPTGALSNRTGEQLAASERTFMIIAISVTAIYSAICALGLLGNVLVMYGVVRYTKMKTATNIYIFNLAMADALATSTLPFQSAKYLMRTWPFGELLFRALEFRTPVKAKIINVCIWILASAVGIPIMIVAVTVRDNGNTTCMLKFPEPGQYYDNVMKICVFIFAFVVPVLVISVCYGLMILRLKSVRLLSGSKEKDKNLRRITHMVLVVVAAFIICWTPIHIFIIIKAFIKIDQKNPLVVISWHLCIALGYMNSSLNPVLYAFLDENFKRCFREFCLPFRSHMDQRRFSQNRNTMREPASVCGLVDSVRKAT